MSAVAQAIDLTPIIDRQKVGAFHIKLIIIAFLVVMADGYDIGAAAFAGPALIREWHVAPQALGGMFSAGLPGLVAAKYMATYGWQILFWVGGIAPMLVAVLVYFLLPESIKFLSL